jgi:glycosyltransferase involved in cell wall biosynthesis
MLEKSDSLITILCVNFNTSDFIEVMLYSFKRLTAQPYEVLIVDNGSNDKHLLRLAKVAQDYTNVKLIYRRQTVSGSIGHGEAMDLLVSMVRTPYFVTMDSDAVFLIRNWDEILISRINEKIKAIGTQASGKKIKDFPLMYAVLYSTDAFKKSNARFLPSSNFGQDGQNNYDTGWQVRENFIKCGYYGEVLKFKNTRTYHDGPYADMLAAEYYMDEVHEIFVSHFGRGSSGGLPKIQNWWRKIPLIGSIFARIIARSERKLWIARSRLIINRVCEAQ